MSFFPMETIHIQSLYILHVDPILTSKVVHENFTTYIEWNVLKTIVSQAWEIN